MIAMALCKAFPGKEWTYNHGKSGYEGLVWLSDSPKPTEAEFDNAIATYEPEPVADRLEQVISALEKKGVLSRADVESKP